MTSGTLDSADWAAFLIHMSEIGVITHAARAAGIRPYLVFYRRKHDAAFRGLVTKLTINKYGEKSSATWDAFFEKLAEGMVLTHISLLPGMPKRQTVQAHMRRDPEFRARVRQYTLGYENGICPPPPPRNNRVEDRIWDRFIERLAQGACPTTVCREPGMPSITTFQRNRLNNPELAARIAAVYTPRTSSGLKTRATKPKPALLSRCASAEARKERLLSNELYAAASAAVSAHLPEHIRDDVISEIVLAVLLADLTLDQIKASAGKFMAAHYKMHPTKFGPISLDAPAYRDGGRDTIGDTVSVGLWAA